MDLKSRIGESAGPYTEDVSDPKVLSFIRAVGAKSDKDVPPTFITRCRRGEFDLFQKLGVPLSRVLHGEQEYIYQAPIRIGDQLQYTTKLAQVFEKRGANDLMTFLVFETELKSVASGAQVATSRTTVIVRGAL